MATRAALAIQRAPRCGRGEIGRRNGLEVASSAHGETHGAELLKFGEPFFLAIPSQAGAIAPEGVETRRAAPTSACGYPHEDRAKV